MAGTWATLTPRSTGIVAAGLLALLVAIYTLHLLLFTLGVLAISFVAAEYLSFSWSTRGFSPTWFQAERFEAPRQVNRTGLGTVGLRVTHYGRAAFYAELWDAYPETLRLVDGSSRLVTWWAPGETLTLAFAFRPYRRGKYSLGPTAIFAHDAFGFAFRLTYLRTEHDLTVVPSVPSLPMGSFAARLRTRFLGTTVLRRRGYGTEFRSLREYSPEDDFRSIAWKRSTRGKLYVKEFEQEMRQDFLVLLDASAAMGAGRLGEDALDIAVDAATVLSSYVGRKDDRLGLLAFADREIAYVAPGRGAPHAARVLEAMAVVNAEATAFNLSGALDLLAGRLKERTHVFAFTTVGKPSPQFREVVARFRARGHRLYLFAPESFAMYPPYEDPLGQRLLSLSQRSEGARMAEGVRAARAAGVPVMVYDRKGAVSKVVGLYSTLRTWGWAR